MNNNGPPPAAAASSSNSSIPSFVDDPHTCLTMIANRPASLYLWNLLGGSVAACMKQPEKSITPNSNNNNNNNANNNDNNTSVLCALYLQAVAQQIMAMAAVTTDHLPTGTTAAAAAAIVDVEASNNNNNTTTSMEAELARAQQLNEILEVRAINLPTTKTIYIYIYIYMLLLDSRVRQLIFSCVSHTHTFAFFVLRFPPSFSIVAPAVSFLLFVACACACNL